MEKNRLLRDKEFSGRWKKNQLGKTNLRQNPDTFHFFFKKLNLNLPSYCNN